MSWSTTWAAVGSIAGLGALILAATIAIIKGFHTIKGQNAEQLRHQEEERQKRELFERDWNGIAARAGVPAQPGVIERLGKIEINTGSVTDRVTALEARATKTESIIEAHIAGHIPAPPL